MKKIIYILLVAFYVIGCSSTNDEKEENEEAVVILDLESLRKEHYPQKWNLVRMTGSLQGMTPLEGENLDWKESYVLQSDGYFRKSRQILDSEVREAMGTYAFLEDAHGIFLELTYSTGLSLVSDCTPDAKEQLWLSADNELHATWNACDGPGLIYALER